MTERDYRHALDDMLAAIDGIHAATSETSFEQYRSEWLLRHAVERAVEIISEASRVIPSDMQELRPEIPWSKVRGIGSILRHGYHSVSDRVIWGVVKDELPRLKQALLAIRTASGENRDC